MIKIIINMALLWLVSVGLVLIIMMMMFSQSTEFIVMVGPIGPTFP
jgi:hypothetical protein